jgi:transcriptional regulator with XRE-family HTH domain
MDTLSPLWARRFAKLSTSSLAARLGVDASTINRWEHGRLVPRLTDAARLLEVCGVRADQLPLLAEWFAEQA